MQAIILAAGMGKRLKELTRNNTKCMVKVNGVTLIERMLKQKYANGDWIGRTLKICPGCLSLYHFVPAAFVLGIVVTTVLALFGFWQLSALMWGLYALFALVNTVLSGISEGFTAYYILMPVLFLLLHVSYGVGTWAGLFKKTAEE